MGSEEGCLFNLLIFRQLMPLSIVPSELLSPLLLKNLPSFYFQPHDALIVAFVEIGDFIESTQDERKTPVVVIAHVVLGTQVQLGVPCLHLVAVEYRPLEFRAVVYFLQGFVVSGMFQCDIGKNVHEHSGAFKSSA